MKKGDIEYVAIVGSTGTYRVRCVRVGEDGPVFKMLDDPTWPEELLLKPGDYLIKPDWEEAAHASKTMLGTPLKEQLDALHKSLGITKELPAACTDPDCATEFVYNYVGTNPGPAQCPKCGKPAYLRKK